MNHRCTLFSPLSKNKDFYMICKSYYMMNFLYIIYICIIYVYMKLYINWILGIKSILSQLRECIMSLSESHGPRKTGGCLYLTAKDILKECLNVRETILQSVRHKEEILLSNNSYSLGKLLRQQIRISPAFICNHLLATEEWGEFLVL